MGRWSFAIACVMVAACSRAASADPAPQSQPSAPQSQPSAPQSQPQSQPSKPPPAKAKPKPPAKAAAAECKSNSDCEIYCPQAPGCCPSAPCGCMNAIPTAKEHWIDTHQKACRKPQRCPEVDCAIEESSAVCDHGHCTAVKGFGAMAPP